MGSIYDNVSRLFRTAEKTNLALTTYEIRSKHFSSREVFNRAASNEELTRQINTILHAYHIQGKKEDFLNAIRQAENNYVVMKPVRKAKTILPKLKKPLNLAPTDLAIEINNSPLHNTEKRDSSTETNMLSETFSQDTAKTSTSSAGVETENDLWIEEKPINALLPKVTSETLTITPTITPRKIEEIKFSSRTEEPIALTMEEPIKSVETDELSELLKKIAAQKDAVCQQVVIDEVQLVPCSPCSLWAPLKQEKDKTIIHSSSEQQQCKTKRFKIHWTNTQANTKGTVTLNQSQTKSIPDTIDIGKVYDRLNEKIEKTDDHSNLLVAVLTAKKAGWKSIKVYEEMPQKKREIVKELCVKNNMSFSVIETKKSVLSLNDIEPVIS